MIGTRYRQIPIIDRYRNTDLMNDLQLQCNEVENFNSHTSINDSLEGISKIQFTEDAKNLYLTCVDMESDKIIHKKRNKKRIITTESEAS
jgi:hypothetical protein